MILFLGQQMVAVYDGKSKIEPNIEKFQWSKFSHGIVVKKYSILLFYVKLWFIINLSFSKQKSSA